MTYKMKNTPSQVRNALNVRLSADNQAIVEKALEKIDKNLSKLVLSTDLTYDEEILHDAIMDRLTEAKFDVVFHSSEAGDCSEPMDYGSSAYIQILV